MRPYKEHRPTGFDSHIAVDHIESWLIAGARNRDSDCLEESNFACTLKALGGEGTDVEVHRFGHWACGWYELILVRPGSEMAEEAEQIEAALSDYPVLDEHDLSEREMNAANETWRHCYSQKQRIEYIRDNREQFDFRSFVEMLGCARGKYFAGYASELLIG